MNYIETQTLLSEAMGNYDTAEKVYTDSHPLKENATIIDIINDFDEKKKYLKPFSNEVRKFYLESIDKADEINYSLNDIPDYGNVYSIESFKDMCKETCFIDSDGFGRLIIKNKMTQFEVKPSLILEKPEIFSRYEGIVWFNK